jgi:hypothetical protein
MIHLNCYILLQHYSVCDELHVRKCIITETTHTHTGDRNTCNQDTSHVIHISARNRKQNTGRESITVHGSTLISKFLQAFNVLKFNCPHGIYNTVTDLLKAFMGNSSVNTFQSATVEDVSQWTNVIARC